MINTYQIIYVDPPWHYRDKGLAGSRGASCKYPVLTTQQITALAVERLAATDCCLFLWATMPNLPAAFKVVERWGFKYKTVAFTWVKYNKNTGSLFWGMGNWTRANAEVCLLATKGTPKRISASVHSIVETPVGQYSAKPPIVRDRIVNLCGDVPRIELFARTHTPGWDVSGQ